MAEIKGIKPIGGVEMKFYTKIEDVPKRTRTGKYAEMAEQLETKVPKGSFISAAEFAKTIAKAVGVDIAKVRGSVWARLSKNGKWIKRGDGVFEKK